jgi:hypothetical protein
MLQKMHESHWTEALQSDQPLLRHFDDASDIEPLILTSFSCNEFQLSFRFASLKPPLRPSPKWGEAKISGTEFEFVGDSCQRLAVEGIFLDEESILSTSECVVKALQADGDSYREIETPGIRFEIMQRSAIVLSANIANLRLTRLIPIGPQDVDRIRHPEKYA